MNKPNISYSPPNKRIQKKLTKAVLWGKMYSKTALFPSWVKKKFKQPVHSLFRLFSWKRIDEKVEENKTEIIDSEVRKFTTMPSPSIRDITWFVNELISTLQTNPKLEIIDEIIDKVIKIASTNPNIIQKIHELPTFYSCYSLICCWS